MVSRFDHAAVAVSDLRTALALFRDLLGGTPVQAVSDDRFDALQFEFPEGPRLEAIAPGGKPGLWMNSSTVLARAFTI
jgi:hypothetical protein